MKHKIYISILVLSSMFFSCNKNIVDSKKNIIQQVNHNIPGTQTSVNLSTASSLAITFLQNRFHNTSLSVQNATTLTRNGIPYFHIINANKGFSIVAVDSMLLPILAYDSSGNFSLEQKDINTGLALWLNKQAAQVDFIRNTRSAYTDTIASHNKLAWLAFNDIYGNNSAVNVRKQDDKSGNTRTPGTQNAFLIGSCSTFSGNDGYWTNIGPLCGVLWYQGDPYNEYCPTGPASGSGVSNGHEPTGCDATAIVQLMRYWNYPASYNLSSQAPYVDKTNPLNDPTKHPERYSEVALLMHDVGISSVPLYTFNNSGGLTISSTVFENYASDVTTAKLSNAPYVFSKFGYRSTGTLAGYQSQSTPIFSGPGNNSNTSLIVTEIANNRPCLLDGWPGEAKQLLGAFYTATGSGHTWVCDGVNTFNANPYTGTACDYSDKGLVITKTYSGAYVQQVLLHMNWGYGTISIGGPNNDGWYDISTDYMLTYGGTDYKYFQQVLYNIHP